MNFLAMLAMVEYLADEYDPKPGRPRGGREHPSPGTHSGYVVHRQRGEVACADCLAAHREYTRAAEARRRTRA